MEVLPMRHQLFDYELEEYPSCEDTGCSCCSIALDLGILERQHTRHCKRINV